MRDLTSKKKINIDMLMEIIDYVPISIILWNSNFQTLTCNKAALNLFGFNKKEELLETFYTLSPHMQPNKETSSELFISHQIELAKNGNKTFNWMHLRKDGTEFPCQIRLQCLEGTDEEGENIIVSFVHDLSDRIAGFDSDLTDISFFNQVSDRTLFKSIAELADEWFWIYDMKQATIQFFGKGREILNLTAEKQPFPRAVVDSGIVFKEDLQKFLNFHSVMSKGVIEPVEVRFILPDGSIRYYKIIYKLIYDNKGNPLFAVGKTYDIHEQKTLEYLSRTDSLTGCLNKMTTENSVNEEINSSRHSTHALFIIDIDNFKAVNDNLGHYFGDTVLHEISDKLHANFRDEDIIGRIGGDEFIVFIKNICDKRIIDVKANAIANVFKNSYSGEKEDYKISGSVGVSIFPQHGSNYSELYRAADKALYNSKLSGKDCFTVYSAGLQNISTKGLTVVDNEQNSPSYHYDAELLAAVFEILFEAPNVKTAIYLTLQMIGRHYDVERCYLIEKAKDKNSIMITHEWCSSGTVPQKLNTQLLTKEMIENKIKLLDEEDVLHCSDTSNTEMKDIVEILDENNVKSFLLAQAKNKNQNRLVIGLDDCKSKRVWNQKEINSMKNIVKMILTFLMKNCMPELDKNDELLLSKQELILLEKLRSKGFVIQKKKD